MVGHQQHLVDRAGLGAQAVDGGADVVPPLEGVRAGTTERVLGAVTAGSVRAFEGGAAQHSTVSALTARMRRETLTAAGAAGERGAVGGNSGSEDAGPACARCGHGRRAHEHYRSGSDCALCDYPRFSRPLLRRLLGR